MADAVKILTDVVKILRAFRPGDVVFIEVGCLMSATTRKRLEEYIKSKLDGTDVRVVILDCGMRVASREEISVSVTPDH